MSLHVLQNVQTCVCFGGEGPGRRGVGGSKLPPFNLDALTRSPHGSADFMLNLVTILVPFGALWLTLAPFWLTFGALWLTFGALGVTFVILATIFSLLGSPGLIFDFF